MEIIEQKQLPLNVHLCRVSLKGHIGRGYGPNPKKALKNAVQSAQKRRITK